MGVPARKVDAEVLSLPRRVSAAVLSEYLGIALSTVRYRVLQGKLPGPGRDGLFDRVEALKAYKQSPKLPVGRKPGWKVQPEEGRAAPEVKIKKAVDETADEAPPFVDPDTRYRTAKAEQEEIKLGHMRDDSIAVDAVHRRVFHLFRIVRDKLDAKVSRSSSIIAAELGAEEGLTFRLLRGMVKELQGELAGMDLAKLLGSEPEGEEAVATDAAEDEHEPEEPTKPAAPPTKRKRGRPKKGS